MISQQTIDEVKERAVLSEVINNFVPLKKQGPNYVCQCMFHADDKPSFTVDPLTNLYKCFGCGKGGNCYNFLMEYSSASKPKWTFQESILYLAKKYNIYVQEEGTKKTYIKPVWSNQTELSNELVKWFEKVRGISQKTLKKMRITESMEYMYEGKRKLKNGEVQIVPAGEIRCINFNYFRNGELINIKYRDAIKRMKMVAGAELIFYNIDSLADAKEVYFVEGEIEVHTLIECGLDKPGTAILSVPNGANIKGQNMAYLDSAMELLEKIEFKDKPIFHIATDNDAAGRKLREDLAERLGKDRCDYIEWRDKKDANEVLVADGPQAVIDCVNNPKEFPISGVYKASVFKDAVDDMYVNGIDRGVGIGIEGFDKLLRFVTGYITLLTGYPNSGKSDFADEIMVRLMLHHGWKGGVYSPENYPTPLHISKLARKLIGKNWYGKEKINEQEKDLVMKFLEDRVYFIIPEKDFSADSLLNHVLQLKRRYGIKFFLFDAWNRIEHKHSGNNEVKYITETLIKIDHFCKEHNLHCFLIAHPTKPMLVKKNGSRGEQEDFKLPVATMHDISGGAQFNNIIANGISVYRDYGVYNNITKKYDNQISKVYVQKVKMQPYWGHQGMCEFKYHIPSGRYNEIIGGNAIMDISNWITGSNRQEKLRIEDENETTTSGIFTDDGSEPPF